MLVALLARLERGARVAATTVIVGALAWHGIAFGLEHAAFDFREGERKHVAIGETSRGRCATAASICPGSTVEAFVTIPAASPCAATGFRLTGSIR